jgi:transposase
MTKPRVEEITSVERRRRWSREEKERLVAASLAPGVTASELARSAGIHVSQLFRWRKGLCGRSEVSTPQLVPVEVAQAPVPGTTGNAFANSSGSHPIHDPLQLTLGQRTFIFDISN